MSVFRQGPSFLARRLTELYTDTKSTCENVTNAASTNDDPELVALNQKFRAQKDRLLAWGLEWSDASAAQPNDIDDALNKAGFSDVVAGVMSSMQEILNEAEEIQSPKGPAPATDGKVDSGKVKQVWTTEAAIARLKVLLEQMNSHIETLYTLSQSRKNMSMNVSSGIPQTISSKPLKEKQHLLSNRKDVKSPEKDEGNRKAREAKGSRPDIRLTEPVSHNQLLQLIDATKDFYIDSSALQRPCHDASEKTDPPPYELDATPHPRLICKLPSSAMPPATANPSLDPVIPVMVEFLPIVPEMKNAHLLPSQERLARLHATLNQLIDHSRVSHLGLLKFIGYYIDAPGSRYAFVYHIPPPLTHLYKQPLSPTSKDLEPQPLASFLYTMPERQASRPPRLEHRFLLAYHLSLTLLHIRSQNLIHGNINSHNILVFSNLAASMASGSESVRPDFVYPYLVSLAHSDSTKRETAPESMALSIYRHPDDNRILSDRAAWAYDFYSLGLVLLEIGLWIKLSALWKPKYSKNDFKSRLEQFWAAHALTQRCDYPYARAVQLCLLAPSFIHSKEPMADLALKSSKMYTYPWCDDPSKGNDWNVFSKNFAMTITKMLHDALQGVSRARIPAFLDRLLPPPLDSQAEPVVTIPMNHKPSELARMNQSQAQIRSQRVVKHAAEETDKQPRKRTLRKMPSLDIPDSDLDIWNKAAMPKISKLLQKVLNGSPESCSVSLVMAGDAPETAKPTICVTCASVKKVRAGLKRYFNLDPRWDLLVLRGSVQHSTVPRSRRPRCKSSALATGQDKLGFNPCYQKKPICGASIGTFRHDEHLPPVSYGGVILVDGAPYGMTVHHMLDAPENEDEGSDVEDDLPPRSSANDWVPSAELLGLESRPYSDDEGDNDSLLLEVTDDEDDDDDTESLAPSLYDDYALSDGYSTDEDGDDDDTASIGDTVGIEPGEQPQTLVTQPALDDVETGFFRSLESRDDEHLAAHSLGYVYASSGLRRWTRDGIKHEIDWALIKIDESRLEASINVALGNFKPSPCQKLSAAMEQVITLDKVATTFQIGGLLVHCYGRTSGFQSGRISKAMSLLKMHGRQSFSTSYSVDGNFGVPGDSGAWVFDKSTGHVCGHVLAWSEKNRTAYIAPMEILLADIARTLGATSVVLPGSEEAARWREAQLMAQRQKGASRSSSFRNGKPRRQAERKATTSNPVSDEESPSRMPGPRAKPRLPHDITVGVGNLSMEDAEGAGDTTRHVRQRSSRDSQSSVQSSGGSSGSIRGLREVAASSYHNVNALIAWQRTMMGRLPM